MHDKPPHQSSGNTWQAILFGRDPELFHKTVERIL